MNKGLLLSFVCGAIAGAVCIHFIEKSRHEEEIESVKETYRANAGKEVIHMPEKDNVHENNQNPDTEKKEKEPSLMCLPQTLKYEVWSSFIHL